MKVLLLGKNGQVGWELQRSLAPLGELVALDRHSALEDGGCGDLNDPDGLRETVLRLRPDVIVNAAAHTAVDKAESEPELARALNALAPGVLAEAASEVGALLVHYSTDYVFDGSGNSAVERKRSPRPVECVWADQAGRGAPCCNRLCAPPDLPHQLGFTPRAAPTSPGPCCGCWKRVPATWLLANAGHDAVARQAAARLQRWHELDTRMASTEVRDFLVGDSAAWRTLVRSVVEVAAFTDSPVLVTGETGTGRGFDRAGNQPPGPGQRRPHRA